MWQSIFLISAGASLGACCRWGLGLWLNPLFASLSFGTLIANYLGCLLIGIASAFIWFIPSLSSEIRLFFITGFLGSLTTFSAFSAEVLDKLLGSEWQTAISIFLLHTLGSLLFCFVGFWLAKSLFFLK